MLIIADRDPYENAKYIAEHTNKNFLFKSLLELVYLDIRKVIIVNMKVIVNFL